MSMKRVVVLLAVVALVTPVGAWAQIAMSHGHGNISSDGQGNYSSDRTAASAALLPVDETSISWGRVMIVDRASAESVSRDLVCHVFELSGETDYIVMIDDIEVGLFSTDLEGEGLLRLQSPVRIYPEVPEALPPVADLVEARILDMAGTVVLQGALFDMPTPREGALELVYMERTRLNDMDFGTVHGQARVSRDIDDIQYFETLAVGFLSGTAYRIEIDGELAGVVTATVGGIAELELSTGDFGDALPGPMQPIEDLRLVEWFSQEDGALVLSGTFTGINQIGMGGNGSGDCDGTGDGDCDGMGGGSGNGDWDGMGGGSGNGDWDGTGGGGPGAGDCDGTGDGDCDGMGGSGSGSGGHGGGTGDGDCDGTGAGNP